MMTHSDQEQAPDEELYRLYYEEISKRQLSNIEAFDRAILTLSSAALALSLTFFKFVVPVDKAVNIDVLENGWALFLIAITSTLLSFGTGQWALAIELEHAEKLYLEKKKEYENRFNSATKITHFLNIFSGIAFLLALASLVYFVNQNV